MDLYDSRVEYLPPSPQGDPRTYWHFACPALALMWLGIIVAIVIL